MSHRQPVDFAMEAGAEGVDGRTLSVPPLSPSFPVEGMEKEGGGRRREGERWTRRAGVQGQPGQGREGGG